MWEVVTAFLLGWAAGGIFNIVLARRQIIGQLRAEIAKLKEDLENVQP